LCTFSAYRECDPVKPGALEEKQTRETSPEKSGIRKRQEKNEKLIGCQCAILGGVRAAARVQSVFGLEVHKLQQMRAQFLTASPVLSCKR
jgi:hypothetical protein